MAIAALVLAIGATHAGANPALDRARTAIVASDYLGAKTALTEALAAGDAHPDELVEINRLTGTIAAGLGDTTAAVAAFERALALSPKLALPAGTLPKITRPFATAQAFFTTHLPLAVKVDTTPAPPAVRVAIGSDPLGMIAGARATVRVDGGTEQVIDRPVQDGAIAFELPRGHRIDVRVIVRDDQQPPRRGRHRRRAARDRRQRAGAGRRDTQLNGCPATRPHPRRPRARCT